MTTDRDLAVLEPNLFRDIVWLGQRVMTGVGEVTEFAFSTIDSDATFDAAGVMPGHVIVISGITYEIMAVLGGSDVVISRVRPVATSEVLILPMAGKGQVFTVMTFTPQIRRVYEGLLRLAGISVGEEGGEGGRSAPGEGAVVNRGALTHAVSLGTLALVYWGLGACEAADSPANQRGAMYQKRFEAEVDRVVLHLDLDGDGVADATRRLNGGPLIR